MKTLQNLEIVTGGNSINDFIDLIKNSHDPVSGKSFLEILCELDPKYTQTSAVYDLLITWMDKNK